MSRIRWSLLASTESIAESSAEGRTLLFRIGETVYACDVHIVREVLRDRRTTRIPGAPEFVRGLLNVRGNVLTVLDVGCRLEPDRAPVEDGAIIIVQVGGRRVGLVVDEVLRVGMVRPEIPSGGSEGDTSHLVRKLGQLDGRIVFLLDVTELVNQALV